MCVRVLACTCVHMRVRVSADVCMFGCTGMLRTWRVCMCVHVYLCMCVRVHTDACMIACTCRPAYVASVCLSQRSCRCLRSHLWLTAMRVAPNTFKTHSIGTRPSSQLLSLLFMLHNHDISQSTTSSLYHRYTPSYSNYTRTYQLSITETHRTIQTTLTCLLSQIPPRLYSPPLLHTYCMLYVLALKNSTRHYVTSNSGLTYRLLFLFLLINALIVGRFG